MTVLKGILKALLSGVILSLFCGGVYLVGKNTCETVEWGCGKAVDKYMEIRKEIKRQKDNEEDN